jgi:hypothetical protein
LLRKQLLSFRTKNRDGLDKNKIDRAMMMMIMKEKKKKKTV